MQSFACNVVVVLVNASFLFRPIQVSQQDNSIAHLVSIGIDDPDNDAASAARAVQLGLNPSLLAPPRGRIVMRPMSYCGETPGRSEDSDILVRRGALTSISK